MSPCGALPWNFQRQVHPAQCAPANSLRPALPMVRPTSHVRQAPSCFVMQKFAIEARNERKPACAAHDTVAGAMVFIGRATTAGSSVFVYSPCGHRRTRWVAPRAPRQKWALWHQTLYETRLVCLPRRMGSPRVSHVCIISHNRETVGSSLCRREPK